MKKYKNLSNSRRRFLWTVRGGMYLATALTGLLTLFIVAYVLIQGIPNLSWEFISTKPSYLSGNIGILPDILNTVYLVIATLVIVIPLGVGAAVYLTEYATNQKIVAAIEYAAEALSGIPSIIYGLVGMLMFSNNMGTSLMAAGGLAGAVAEDHAAAFVGHAHRGKEGAGTESGRIPIFPLK